MFVDANFVGVVSREQELYDIGLSALPNQTISIIVESQGRVCVGSEINDFKVINMDHFPSSDFSGDFSCNWNDNCKNRLTWQLCLVSGRVIECDWWSVAEKSQ